MSFVRAKMYKPGSDNFGTRWQEVAVDERGHGTFVWTATKPVHFTKYRVATLRNNVGFDRMLDEGPIRPDYDNPGADPLGIEAEPGDTISLDFVVPEFYLRVRLNDDLDEEDLALMNLMSLQRRLKK